MLCISANPRYVASWHHLSLCRNAVPVVLLGLGTKYTCLESAKDHVLTKGVWGLWHWASEQLPKLVTLYCICKNLTGNQSIHVVLYKTAKCWEALKIQKSVHGNAATKHFVQRKKQPHALRLMPNLQEGMDNLEFVIAVLAKFVTVLLSQELYEPANLVRESGDFVVMNLMVCLRTSAAKIGRLEGQNICAHENQAMCNPSKFFFYFFFFFLFFFLFVLSLRGCQLSKWLFSVIRDTCVYSLLKQCVPECGQSDWFLNLPSMHLCCVRSCT